LSSVVYRPAERNDIPALAGIRAADWGTIDFWTSRLATYLDGIYNPLHSLAPRVIYTAMMESRPIGLIAGHLTQRYDCEGELQWISVAAEHRGLGIASRLLHSMAGWFAENNAARVCVNCDTDDQHVTTFFSRHGAVPLNRNWLMWYDIRMHAPAT
jgi:GNAT superfamily N-acetyltransferase